MADRYGADVLAGNPHQPRKARSVECQAEAGLVVEDPQSGYVGAIVRVEGGRVELEDRQGLTRVFPHGPGFWVDGRPVILTAPARAAAAGSTAAQRTASGSVKVVGAKARVALAGRIYVEGRHDAELVEQVWGDDLRVEGVVVEYLGGVDDLAEIVAEFRPGAGRRLGVLVDHLVPGSKEARIAEAVRRGPGGAHTLVVGHPYVDIWQSVKPARVGLAAWPQIPRSIEWKAGICQALGWPHRNQADIARAWQRIRGSVRDWTDLEPELIGRVEELIDFVTQPG
jgi:predicted methyltransferase